ncbi:Aldehyde dehydrogenase PuuC [compost metagenome]
MNSYDLLYINGQWVAPLMGGTFDTIDPCSEAVIARVAAATAEDVGLAVKAARQAFDEGPWPHMSGSARAAVLRRIAQGIRDRQQELAELEVRDNGKPLPEALWDIGDTAGCFDFYADLAEGLDSHMERPVALADERFSSVARKEPIGVAGAIIPWNFPMLMAAWKVAPALAAGCCMAPRYRQTRLHRQRAHRQPDHAGGGP